MKTISKKYLALFMLVALVLFNACEKEEEVVYVNNNNSNIVLDFFKSNLNDAKQITSVDLSSASYILGNKGAYIYISPCSFLDENGNSVTGVIDFELIEAQTNLDMLKINRPTFTKDGQLLVSGGVVYVNATQNGIALQINPDCSLHANIQSGVGTIDSKPMEYFVGSEDENGVFAWEQEISDTVTTILQDTTNSSGVSYGFPIDSVGWINCDYFNGSVSTTVLMELPSGYDGSNTQGFIYYSNINSLTGLYDFNQDGVFGSGAPVGMNVNFLSFSGDSINGYYYNITPSTIVSNHYEVISTMKGPVTYADLEILFDSNL